MLRIEPEAGRFRDIVKGKVRENLKKYITRGEMIGRMGKDLVSIPVPDIDTPNFRYGAKEVGGVGQGEGEIGMPLGPGDEGGGSGAGNMPGEHILEVELTIEELAQILGEELELPRIEPKGKNRIEGEELRYNSVRRTGPESLRHLRRSFKKALKRHIISGDYNFNDPRIVVVREDKLYRAPKPAPKPETAAVIIYMMDVSGSMSDKLKEIVRIEMFWIDAWIRAHYKGVEARFIIHDAAAREVDRDTFFHTRESGGTKISSAYELCREVVKLDYSPDDWNIYLFHFSDGENWEDDDDRSVSIARELLLSVNLFGYGQVFSGYGSGDFINHMEKLAKERDNVVASKIEDRDGIWDSIKQFLGKGK